MSLIPWKYGNHFLTASVHFSPLRQRRRRLALTTAANAKRNTELPRAHQLYGVLLERGYRDGERLPSGAPAAIWHAIDSRRAAGGGGEEVRILEDLAVEVHVLKQSLMRLADEADGDLAPRCRIAALTRQWLEFAPLGG